MRSSNSGRGVGERSRRAAQYTLRAPYGEAPFGRAGQGNSVPVNGGGWLDRPVRGAADRAVVKGLCRGLDAG
jgi:hypothetical protein